VSDAEVILTWQGVTGAVSYMVYWEIAGSPVESRPVSETVFTHNGLVNGTSYTYWVKSVDAAGLESSPSVRLTATPKRYTDNGNGTVTDNRNGLIWLKNANCFDKQNWETAMQSAANLANGQCGLSDGSTSGMWRLPTKEEWEAMVDKSYSIPVLSNAAGTGQWTEGDAFSGVQSTIYWSSTTLANVTTSACFVTLDVGYVNFVATTFTTYLWPVRDGN
jgi:hypothetical protein